MSSTFDVLVDVSYLNDILSGKMDINDAPVAGYVDIVEHEDNEPLSEDSLFVDERRQFSQAEVDILNMQVTPEIQAILDNMLMEKAAKEAAEWYRGIDTTIPKKSDYQLALDRLMFIQDEIGVAISAAKANTIWRQKCWDMVKEKKAIYKDWTRTPEYGRMNSAQKEKHYRLHQAKVTYLEDCAWFMVDYVKGCWNLFHQLVQESKDIADQFPGIWKTYFSIANEPITRYWINGDTEEVDNAHLMMSDNRVQVILNGVDRVVKTYDATELRDAHLDEMAEYDLPESKGIGYWSFSNEYKIKNANTSSQDNWFNQVLKDVESSDYYQF